MGRLMKELFDESPLLTWPILALALFGAAFIVISVRVAWRSKALVEREAALPLDDGEAP